MSALNKHILATLITLAGTVSAAHADVTTLSSGGGSLTFTTAPAPVTLTSPGGSLTFSQDLLSALRSGGVEVTPISTSGPTPISSGAKLISSGGSVTVTDLRVDLTNKLIYANLLTGNQSTPTNVSLFQIGDISTTGVTPLALSQQGLQLFQNSLNLNLSPVIFDYGVISSTLTAIPTIPEPATYVLMAVGLIGLGLAKRRQRG